LAQLGFFFWIFSNPSDAVISSSNLLFFALENDPYQGHVLGVKPEKQAFGEGHQQSKGSSMVFLFTK